MYDRRSVVCVSDQPPTIRHGHTHTHTHTRTHTRTRAHTHTCTHARAHIHTHARTHIHTLTHTHTHTHTHTNSKRWFTTSFLRGQKEDAQHVITVYRVLLCFSRTGLVVTAIYLPSLLPDRFFYSTLFIKIAPTLASQSGKVKALTSAVNVVQTGRTCFSHGRLRHSLIADTSDTDHWKSSLKC